MVTKAIAKKATVKKAALGKSATKKVAVKKTATTKKKAAIAAPPAESARQTLRKTLRKTRASTSEQAQMDARNETRRMVLAAVAACEDKKAEDIRILELDPADSGFTDFFLIASGTNERQVQAIGDEIELRMKREFGTYANSVEGRRQSEWILIDYVDFVVHIFSAERRAFYDIERLRKSATQVDVEQLKAALAERAPEEKKPHAKKTAAKKLSAKRVIKVSLQE